MDSRNIQLANTLVNYSCKVQPGEKVLIQFTGEAPVELADAIIKEVYAAGGYPFFEQGNKRLQRRQLLGITEEAMKLQASWEAARMNEMDCFIGFSGLDNMNEFSDIPAEKMAIYQKHLFREVHGKIRISNTRWVVLRYPSTGMAQMANMSTEAFEDFYYDICTLDYNKMSKAMDAMVELMEKTDKVRIKGKGTDLTFSIKGLPAIKCAGEVNLPDGEIFTAPVRDSVNGQLTYNTPSEYQGYTYENICLTFKDGQIIDAVANDTERITQVFDTDQGARYIGEFAIGVNPYILTPMNETLFDEKIMGSFHFTPGNAYDDCDNGNKSAIHWDLVCIQTPEYGGGEIYFDDVLIRKDGMFVIDELLPLNPENLK